MEMLLYHLPNARTIGRLVWQRSITFMKKDGTTILTMALVIWIFSMFPLGRLSTSYPAQFRKFLECWAN